MAYTKIMPRGGTLYEWSTMNPVLAEREFAVEFPDSGIGTGLCRFKFGDGFKTYNELPYAFDGASASSIIGGNAFAGNTIQIRADSYDNWMLANPILEENEIIYDTTRHLFFLGDGVSRFNQLKPAGQQLIYDFGDEDEDNIISPIGDGKPNVSGYSISAPAATLADLMNTAIGNGTLGFAPVDSDEGYIVTPEEEEKVPEMEVVEDEEETVYDEITAIEEEEELSEVVEPTEDEPSVTDEGSTENKEQEEELPVEEPVVEDVPVEDIPAEEAPVVDEKEPEESVFEEVKEPVEVEQPEIELPYQEPTEEEVPAEEPVVAETEATEEAPVEEVVEEPVVEEEVPTEETVVEETTVDDGVEELEEIEEPPANETPTEEKYGVLDEALDEAVSAEDENTSVSEEV